MRVCVVDDDFLIGRQIQDILEPAEYQVSYFGSSREYLSRAADHSHDLLICDVEMPENDGFAVLKEVRQLRPALPVILIASQADIPGAVRAIKMGAEYFIKKPFQPDHLLEVVNMIRKTELLIDFPETKKLTPHELRVLKLLLRGYKNPDIAAILDRSVRTIEDHRNKIMRKFRTRNVIELIRKFTPREEKSKKNVSKDSAVVAEE